MTERSPEFVRTLTGRLSWKQTSERSGELQLCGAVAPFRVGDPESASAPMTREQLAGVLSVLWQAYFAWPGIEPAARLELAPMTMLSREDPHSQTGQCMKCGAHSSRRHTATFENALRTWLCPPCQAELVQVVSEQLRVEAGDDLNAHCNRARGNARCAACQDPGLAFNLSVFDLGTFDVIVSLCYGCQRLVTQQARLWLRPAVEDEEPVT